MFSLNLCFFLTVPVHDCIVFEDFCICHRNLNVEKRWVELPPLDVLVCLEVSSRNTLRLTTVHKIDEI